MYRYHNASNRPVPISICRLSHVPFRPTSSTFRNINQYYHAWTIIHPPKNLCSISHSSHGQPQQQQKLPVQQTYKRSRRGVLFSVPGRPHYRQTSSSDRWLCGRATNINSVFLCVDKYISQTLDTFHFSDWLRIFYNNKSEN